MDNPLKFKNLKEFWHQSLKWDPNEVTITQLFGGYSNLTFLVETPIGKFIMRRAPFGEKIDNAHDMVREGQVLDALDKAGYTKSPKPTIVYEDENLNGSPLLIMKFVEGMVLRDQVPEYLNFDEAKFKKLSENVIDSLLELHLLELKSSGLIHLGKPEGYVMRQVEGWIDRYHRAKTDELPEMKKVAAWLLANLPQKQNIGFIHNDFKYNNIVVSRENPTEVKAVLDWEMATVGDPLMDLGTTLAYWAEADDPPILKSFNLTHAPGNMTRKEVVSYYNYRSPLDLSDILFYYVFGLFKVATIAQQIHRRYLGQVIQDPRFTGLVHVVEAGGKKAEEAIRTEKI